MAAQVKELTKEVEKWKNKYQKTKQAYNSVQNGDNWKSNFEREGDNNCGNL